MPVCNSPYCDHCNPPKPAPEAEIRRLRRAIEHELDACFCDDGRNLPECERCVRLRAVLDVK